MIKSAHRRIDSRRLFSLAVGSLLAFTEMLYAHAGEEQNSKDKSERDRRIDQIRDYAAEHRIAPADALDAPFQLRPHPLLFWTNPTRGNVYGGIFAWTLRNRPMVIGGVYVWVMDSGNEMSREFHSLSETPLQAEFRDAPLWAPSEPDVKFKPVPNAKSPSAKAVSRLREMKRIAEQFTVLISKSGVKPEIIRLLPRPIYRYEDEETGVVDGAIFAFVQGTDPEAYLLVEARTKDNARSWQYTVARGTAWAVEVRLGENTVREFPLYDFTQKHESSSFFIPQRLPVK